MCSIMILINLIFDTKNFNIFNRYERIVVVKKFQREISIIYEHLTTPTQTPIGFFRFPHTEREWYLRYWLRQHRQY
ncbi:unnamed protein product, partial [Vitis vinifera]|uniref:Uncharacterized protein n=1 Tax=Vitis vinifera TaxID=29760 RepID=D7SIL6_VITVI